MFSQSLAVRHLLVKRNQVWGFILFYFSSFFQKLQMLFLQDYNIQP